MDYRTKGVCSQSIHFDIEDNKIHNVSFVGGCNGNLQGISHLVGGHLTPGRNPVWIQENFLPGPTCSGTERSNRKII